MIKWLPKGFPNFQGTFHTCVQPGYTILVDNSEQAVSTHEVNDLQHSVDGNCEHNNDETVL